MLAVVLALAAAMQMLVATPPELPVGSPVARATSARVPAAPPPVIAVPGIVARAMFTPPAVAPGGAAVAVSGPVFEGAISVRGRSLAIVRLPGGAIRNIAPGGMIEGWRLVAIVDGGVVMQRDGQRKKFAFGTPATSAASADNEEQQ